MTNSYIVTEADLHGSDDSDNNSSITKDSCDINDECKEYFNGDFDLHAEKANSDKLSTWLRPIATNDAYYIGQ